nr:MAG TPA: hypothetical protein [Caudoviricetes sp.]
MRMREKHLAYLVMAFSEDCEINHSALPKYIHLYKLSHSQKRRYGKSSSLNEKDRMLLHPIF